MTSTIQSVGSSASVYAPSQHMSLAPPPAARDPQSAAPASSPAVTLLVKQNPSAGAACTEEAAKLAVASVNLLRSLGPVVVGAPTLLAEIPAILGFIAAAVVTGAAAADYANCMDNAGPERPE